eukprot:8363001-Alexandrium_andersonii.AAC.1
MGEDAFTRSDSAPQHLSGGGPGRVPKGLRGGGALPPGRRGHGQAARVTTYPCCFNLVDFAAEHAKSHQAFGA